MKNVIFLISVFLAANFFLLAGKSLANTPSWVTSRPISRDFYIGIGACNKEDIKGDCRKAAEDKAFLELSSEISVDISGSFVQKIVERTGLSEQDVRMEIRTSSRARLSGHELVGEWEDKKNHWVYFRLSKQQYQRQRMLEREKAVAAAVDMLTRAGAAKTAGDAVSALRFYFEALAKVQDFIGENIQTTFQNRSVFLFNEIYANIQLIMADVQLTADRKRVPVFIGEPRHEPFTIVATLKNENGEKLYVAGLPIRFAFPRDTGGLHRSAATDYQGRANGTLVDVTAADNGKTVRAYVEIDALCPAKDTRGFFRALIDKLTVPEVSLAITTFEDEETFLWHREFEGKNVLILSGYQTKESSAEWTKIRGELINFIKGKGASIQQITAETDFQNAIRLSESSGTQWRVDTFPHADMILVMAAVGKLNKRENANNPFGEDVQFAGEIRTLAHKSGRMYFSDQYKGATGWNPMGADMCMDVLALHVFKRWKLRYMEQLKE